MALSMSGLPRTEACIASAVLPALDEGAGAYASHGNAVHDYLDAIAKGVPREQALAAVPPEHLAACEAIDLDLVPHGQADAWVSEQPMAYNWMTGEGRFLERGAHRQYGILGEHELPGTADLVGQDGDTVVVLDVKTGHRWLGAPEKSLQLLAYAVTAAAALGCTRAKVGFLYVQEGQEPRLKMGDVDELGLVEAAERIRALMMSVDWARSTGEAPTRLGDHCTYCPAQRGCPAKVRLWNAMLANHIDVGLVALGGVARDGGRAVIHAEDLPRALELVKLAGKMVDLLEDQVKDAIRAVGPIELPERPGYVLAEVECPVETLDGNVAKPILKELFGDSAEKAVVTKTTVTKSAIDDLVRERAKQTKEKIGALNKQVLDRIREAGGVRVSTHVEVKPVKRATRGEP